MRAQIKRQDLSRALSAVGRAAPKKSNLPILSHVLLDAEDGWMQLTATNLDLTIRSAVPAETKENGRTTVTADMLSSWLQFQDKGATIDLHASSGKIHIANGKSVSNLKTGEPDDFPVPPDVDPHAPDSIEVDPKALESALSEVLHAAATDDTRPVLAGVYLELVDGALHLTTADGFRLATTAITRHITATEGAAWSAIVPAKTMAEVQRLLKDIDDPTHIITTPGHIRVSIGTETVVYGRLIAGQFPDFRRLIPKTRDSRVEVDRQALIRAVSSVTLFASGEHRPIRICRDESGGLGLSGNSSDHDGTESVAAAFTGEPWSVKVNGNYLKDALDAMPDPSVVLSHDSSKYPVMILPSERTATLMLVMPVHTPD